MNEEIYNTSVSDGNSIPVSETPVQDNPVDVSCNDVSGGNIVQIIPDPSDSLINEDSIQVIITNQSMIIDKFDNCINILNLLLFTFLITWLISRLTHGVRRLFNGKSN